MYAVEHHETHGFEQHGSLPNRSYRPDNSMIRYMSNILRDDLGDRLILIGDDEVWTIWNYLRGHNTLHRSGMRWVR